MMTIVATALLTLFGLVFGLMAFLPLLLEIDQRAVHPENVVHLHHRRPRPHGTDHRPAA